MCEEAFAPISPASSTERLSAAMRAGVSLAAVSAVKRVRLQWGYVEKAQLPNVFLNSAFWSRIDLLEHFNAAH
ncbi:hypothetical protein TNCV_4068911 [Trichonephila clavipes]|nr:hypothetical protein TNCV_4068911 [Trichonephila clavipes]